MAGRKLIGDDKVIVVLDTPVARELVFAEELPAWVGTFSLMAKAGYAFCLPDAVAAELLLQVRSGRTPPALHERMIRALATFLHPQLRVLPGRTDVMAMIGAHDGQQDVEETAFLSATAWNLLLSPDDAVDTRGPSLEEIREEERCDWQAWVERVSSHVMLSGIDLSASRPEAVAEYLAEQVGPVLDHAASFSPPLSLRRHLEIRHRFRQAARSRQKKDAYNPAGERKKNDAIDIDLFMYLLLPAFVLARDKGFFGSLEGIDSFQRAWLWKPEGLAEQWNCGAPPRPEWPRKAGEAAC